MEIRNDMEYEEVLSRLRKGAAYIESPEFEQKSESHKAATWKLYDELERAILKYKGMI